MADIVYGFGGGLYVNLTNRCSNSCDFCLRKGAKGIGYTSLWLEKEPSANEVIDALNHAVFQSYKNIVFCGYGEPTEALDVLIEVARYIKSKNIATRLNTNGLGSLIHCRDIAPLLVGAIDGVSVSLNASTAAKYDAVCHSRFGLRAYEAVWDFARKCRDAGIDTVMSVVDSIGRIEVEACRRVAEENGIPLKVRVHIADAAQENATRLK